MTEYIKGIIFFLIFVSFAGMLSPDAYKSYVRLVLGFALMFLVFRPVADLGGVIEDVSRQLTQAASSAEGTSGGYEDDYRALIAEAFETRLREQMTLTIEALGHRLTGLAAEVNVETGELKSISLVIRESSAPDATDSGVAPVDIAPLSVGLEGQSAPADSALASDVKKIVSDFYQLSQEHIHVTIQN